jgi:hypothetical protein
MIMNADTLELGTVNLSDILIEIGEDVENEDVKGEEPTDAEMRKISKTVEKELLAWNIYVCGSCRTKQDFLLSKWDNDGNVICPHCKSIN